MSQSWKTVHASKSWFLGSGRSRRTVMKRRTLLYILNCRFLSLFVSSGFLIFWNSLCERGTVSSQGSFPWNWKSPGNEVGLKRLCFPVRNSPELTSFELFRIANTLPDIKMEQSRSQCFGQSFNGELSWTVELIERRANNTHSTTIVNDVSALPCFHVWQHSLD